MQPVDRLMARLTGLFGEPKTEDMDVFLEEFRGALGRYSADVLNGVGTVCRDRFKWFPKISELISLANDVKWDMEAPAREAERVRKAKEDAENHRRDMSKRASKERVAEFVTEFRRVMAERDLQEASKRPVAKVPTRADFEAMQLSSPSAIHRSK